MDKGQHLGEEGWADRESGRETLGGGRRARIPVQINHLKVTGAAHWGSSTRILALLDSARSAGQQVAVDIYPYTAYSTYSDLMFPPWVLADGPSAFARRVADPATRARLVREMRVRFPQQAGDTPASTPVREGASDPAPGGKTLARDLPPLRPPPPTNPTHNHPDAKHENVQALRPHPQTWSTQYPRH